MFNISGYKGMWVFTMFDLPVTDTKKRREYTRFRKGLLRRGFSMLQYSVYARYFPSQEASRAYINQLRYMIPPEGEVRLLVVTDKQFGKMEVFYGKKKKEPEKPLAQLLLF